MRTSKVRTVQSPKLSNAVEVSKISKYSKIVAIADELKDFWLRKTIEKGRKNNEQEHVSQLHYHVSRGELSVRHAFTVTRRGDAGRRDATTGATARLLLHVHARISILEILLYSSCSLWKITNLPSYVTVNRIFERYFLNLDK